MSRGEKFAVAQLVCGVAGALALIAILGGWLWVLLCVAVMLATSGLFVDWDRMT